MGLRFCVVAVARSLQQTEGRRRRTAFKVVKNCVCARHPALLVHFNARDSGVSTVSGASGKKRETDGLVLVFSAFACSSKQTLQVVHSVPEGEWGFS